MVDLAHRRGRPGWLWHIPSANWPAEYRAAWLRSDVVAGVTPGGLRHPGFSRLCGACRPAAAGRSVRLPPGWAWLRAARVLTSTGDRTHLCHLAHDCRHGGGHGGRRRATLRTDCQSHSLHGGRALGDLNDIAVHEQRIAAIGIRPRRSNHKRAFAAGLLTGCEDARIDAAMAAATQAYADLAKVKPFWP